jgi:hypothetical protein
MICPECETEYREGFTRCADCDVALVVELTGDATIDEIAGALVPLTMERSADVVAALVEALEAAHVPYVIEAGTALRVLDGAVEDLERPDVWLARISVVAGRSAEAEAILEETRERLDAMS